jgi:uncharacterized protein (DUF2062 family)
VTEQTNFFRRRVAGPVLQLLRYGATPERLAWSLAVGVVIGVNPLLGSTTVLALLLAPLFGLNVVASQLGNHLVYPLELLLFPVFIRLGSLLFHTAGLPLERHAMLSAVKLHPWQTTRLLWSWEWHALMVWVMFAVVAAPVLKMVLRPVLARMLDALHHEPIVEK